MTIFVTAAVDELERRLRERATESSGEIDERIAPRAASSSSEAGSFDYVVENDDLERAAERARGASSRGLLDPAGTMARR